MSFNVGEHVVYSSCEICKIEEKVKRCFDGINEREYLRLIPVFSKGSNFYIPSDDYDGKIRRLLTKEEIYSLIDDLPDSETQWCEDKNQRKSKFFSVLRSDNYHELLSMIRTIYQKRQEQNSQGKKLHASDEKVMHEAEKLIHHEFSFVLGIDEDDVDRFIEERLSAISE